MAKNNTTVLTLTLLITVSLLIIAGGVIWFVSHPQGLNSASTPPTEAERVNPPTHTSSAEQAANPSGRNADFSKLHEYLQRKEWRQADRETYERLLEAAGPKSQAKVLLIKMK